MDLFEASGAIFSPDRKHRYLLWRTWSQDVSRPLVAFIGLNPSTADSQYDDPTIRRCKGFAKSWGYRGVYMANLFTYKVTEPAFLKGIKEKNGPRADHFLEIITSGLFDVVFAWGAVPEYSDRIEEVIRMFPEGKYIKLSKDGHPCHPLYLRGDSALKNFFPRRINEYQLMECATYSLDYPYPDPDRAMDIAEKLDMEYDDETGLFIDHEGVYDRMLKFELKRTQKQHANRRKTSHG